MSIVVTFLCVNLTVFFNIHEIAVLTKKYTYIIGKHQFFFSQLKTGKKSCIADDCTMMNTESVVDIK